MVHVKKYRIFTGRLTLWMGLWVTDGLACRFIWGGLRMLQCPQTFNRRLPVLWSAFFSYLHTHITVAAVGRNGVSLVLLSKDFFFLNSFFFLPYTRVPRAATSAIKPLAGCHAAISTSKITVNNMVPRHSNSDSKV